MNHRISFSSRKSIILSLLLIAVVCLLSYSNTFHVPFQFDDSFNISEKPFVRDISLFFEPARVSPDSVFIMRPVTYFTFAVNYWIHGNDVVGYHIVNIVVHILNAFLVCFLVLLTLRTPYLSSQYAVSSQQSPYSRFIPFAVALLFVCHPIQTQAVTYIVQRTASLATLFYLLSLVMYIKWRLITLQAEGRRQKAEHKEAQNSKHRPRKNLLSVLWYLVSLISAVLAMKTKEIAFTLPLLITLYEFMFFEGKLRRRIFFLMPLLLTMLIIPLSLFLLGTDKPVGEIIGDVSEATRVQTDISRWEYLFTEFRVIVTYIRLLFLPVAQNVDYDYPVYNSFFDPNVFLSFSFLLLILGTAAYLLYASRRLKPVCRTGSPAATPYSLLPTAYFRLERLAFLIAFGIFWFFITLSVESSVIPIADIIFEHRVYLPSAGFFIAVVVTVFLVTERFRNLRGKTAMGVFGLIIIVFSVATYARNNIWLDEMKLWQDVIKKSPSKARAYNNLGYVYNKQGRFKEAVREYQIALRLDPGDFQVHNNLGVAYKGLGHPEEAIREYQNALRLKPDDAFAYYNMGNIFREQRAFEKAIQHYQAAIRLVPDDVAVIHNNLGIAYTGQGNLKEAEREFRIALALDPNFKAARRNLKILLSRGVQ